MGKAGNQPTNTFFLKLKETVRNAWPWPLQGRKSRSSWGGLGNQTQPCPSPSVWQRQAKVKTVTCCCKWRSWACVKNKFVEKARSSSLGRFHRQRGPGQLALPWQGTEGARGTQRCKAAAVSPCQCVGSLPSPLLILSPSCLGESVLDAVTELHRPAGFNNGNVFSHGSGGRKSEIKGPAGLVSGGGSLPVLETAAFSPRPPMAFLPCTHISSAVWFSFLRGHKA